MFAIIITIVVTFILTMWVACNYNRWLTQYVAGGLVAGLSMNRMKYTAEMHRETVNSFRKHPIIMSKLLPNTHVFGNTVFALDQHDDIVSIAQEGTPPLMRMDDAFELSYAEGLNHQEQIYIRSVYDLKFNATRLYEYFKVKYGNNSWALAFDPESDVYVVAWQGSNFSIVRNFYQYGRIVQVRFTYNGEVWSATII